MEEKIGYNMESDMLTEIREIVFKMNEKMDFCENMINQSNIKEKENQIIKIENQRINDCKYFNEMYDNLCQIIKKENKLKKEFYNDLKKINLNEFLLQELKKKETMIDQLMDDIDKCKNKIENMVKQINNDFNQKWKIFENNWEKWNKKDLCAFIAVTFHLNAINQQKWEQLQSKMPDKIDIRLYKRMKDIETWNLGTIIDSELPQKLLTKFKELIEMYDKNNNKNDNEIKNKNQKEMFIDYCKKNNKKYEISFYSFYNEKLVM